MTQASKSGQTDKNQENILASRKKRQEAGDAKGGPGTWSNTRPGTGKIKRS
jgi:hypothetical protein